jgi:multidrug resistance protein MdtO
MASLVLVNVLIGPNPAKLVRRSISRRLAAAAAVLRGEANARETARELLAEDAGELAAPARLSAIFGFQSKDEAQRLSVMMPEVQNVLALSLGARPDPLLAQGFDRLAQAVGDRAALPPGWRAMAGGARASVPLADMVERLAAWWSGRLALPQRDRGENAATDTFTNPAYMQFALKTMLAVFVTYAIYTAGGWFEIHTAMITCFYVALGTTGETLHKAALRIAGCLIGAAMGVGSIVFLMPHLTDIGHLVLLVAVGSFIAAWVANGSNLIQYMGWQMALAFFLCVLQGYGPTFDIDVATNRILGILIGNLVVTIVFFWLWPASVSDGVVQHLSRAVAGLGAALGRAGGSLADVGPELREAGRLARLSAFETSRLRSRSPLLPHAEAIIAATHEALPEAARLHLLRHRPRYLFGAPRAVKAVISTQEEAVDGFLEVAVAAIEKPEPEARTMLGTSLSRSYQALYRLERVARQASSRARWSGELVETARSYRNLLRTFSNALEAL